MVTQLRIWRALQWLSEPNGQAAQHPLLLQLLAPPQELLTGATLGLEASEAALPPGPQRQAMLDFCAARRLNPSQQSAVLHAMGLLAQRAGAGAPGRGPRAAAAGPQPPPSAAAGAPRQLVQLLHGPPGTGKTSTLAALLSAAAGAGARCLVCAPTNAAISEAGARLLQLLELPRGEGQYAAAARLQGLQALDLVPGDLLLAGNEERLKLDGELEELFLPARVGAGLGGLEARKGPARLVVVLVAAGAGKQQACRAAAAAAAARGPHRLRRS